jgi:aminopeptidase N
MTAEANPFCPGGGKRRFQSLRSGSVLVASCALMAATPASAGGPFSFDTAPGRLPKGVVPIDYTIDITPDIETLTVAGQEIVLLEFRSPSATIQFNSLNEKLSDVRLDGTPARSVVSDDRAQLTTVTLPAPAAEGRHTLTFKYTGRIEEQPHGLFLQRYVDPTGTKGELLTTEMDPTDARRMFPCWDEPAFRATFQLRATVPASWASVANMPADERTVLGELATTTFQRTPRMPSYLVEYTTGDLAQIGADAGPVRLGVWAVRGREQDGQTALANAQQILADYDEYFAYPYPLPKLDSIAIPGGFAGAMENWGAITYIADALLVNPSGTLDDRQWVYTSQAHEMAHQWFGDLVTMGWWDDIWLNESFASWMQTKETDRRNPGWHWRLGRDAAKEDAMAADAIAGSHSIEQHVTDEKLLESAPDPGIAYFKGEAILRMFEAYLGLDVFRGGIRRHMKAHAYSNATSADLWSSLSQASGRDVGAIASGWIERPGFPLVSVMARCDANGSRTIDLSQRRFLLTGDRRDGSVWSVPLQIRSGARGTPRALLLSEKTQSVAEGRCDEPLSIDADALGFYRASYDATTLATNTRHFGELPEGDRVALLDDQWALASSAQAPLSSYLALATAMGPDLIPRAWEQIAQSLGDIELAERGTPGHEAFAAYARSLLQPAFERLGWDAGPTETPDVRRLRQEVIGHLGAWGDPAVIAEARRRFVAFRADHRAIAPDDQGVVLGIVSRHADAATFEQLHAIAKASADQAELARYYQALMEVGDPDLAARAAEIALSSEIPPQADTQRLGLVATLADQHQQLAWKTLTGHREQILAPLTAWVQPIVTQAIPSVFWSGVPLSEIEAWARAQVPEEASPAVEHGIDSARFLLARNGTLVREADAYLAKR